MTFNNDASNEYGTNTYLYINDGSKSNSIYYVPLYKNPTQSNWSNGTYSTDNGYQKDKIYMEKTQLMEKMSTKLAQNLIEEQLSKIELQIQYEEVLNELEDVKMQLQQARTDLAILNNHPDTSIKKVSPEDINLPPVNKQKGANL